MDDYSRGGGTRRFPVDSDPRDCGVAQENAISQKVSAFDFYAKFVDSPSLPFEKIIKLKTFSGDKSL